MSVQPDKIDLAKYKESLEKAATLGAKVQEFVSSEGFLVLKAVFYNRVKAIKNKDSYQTLEDFRADRSAVKIIQEMFDELVAMVNNGEQAEAEIKKLIDSESSTPPSLSLDGEGEEEGQLSEF